ncbi:hypothetical protein D3C78_1361930 [compost metagenome]
MACLAVERPAQLLVVIKQITQIQHADLRHQRGPDGSPGDHHVDRADAHLLHRIGFFSEHAVREIVEGNFTRQTLLQILFETVEPDSVCGVAIVG